MNFDEAIRSHTFWKITLRWLVNGRKGLDVAMLGDHRACELGRWLVSEADALAAYPAFAELVREHAEFHRHAAEIARLASEGALEEAGRLLAADSAFMRTSESTIAAIKALKAQAAPGGDGKSAA
ncbi:CZB domain-containing protein [Azoarcus sp. KH32C]|uniref:CZB domain-containing protein n=1 Tax=Azoarcus sp. KH32C TaxID=748247 RepID=UPI0002385E5F|nr:CZB domain-containing protein [Azoarcus sp. KH32C]BAL22364.1 hypothetical protein AZKH_0012 [Azoarcus sp. KH32C]